jgi:calmodulin
MPELPRDRIAELRADFDFNDSNGDGCIQYAEFVALLEDLESDMSEAEARLGFAEIDVDEDGSIDFDEFVRWWTTD